MQIRTLKGREGWSEEETERLLSEVRRISDEGQPLRVAFETVAETTGRKPNSIRNYYYAQIHHNGYAEDFKRAAAFVPFTEGEIRGLTKQVLMARGKGMSVRAIVTQMANGDKTQMLRFQNKYRSVIKSRPELVFDIMEELKQEGHHVQSPLTLRHNPPPVEKMLDQIGKCARDISDERIAWMLEGLEALMTAAAKRGVSYKKLSEFDRLHVNHDLLRMQYLDLMEKYGALKVTAGDVARRVMGMEAAKEIAPALSDLVTLLESDEE